MLDLKIKAAGRRYVAPDGLRAALGAERAREKLADAIEALIVQMDLIDGEPDFEEDDCEDSFVLSDRAIAVATNSASHDVEQDSGGWTEWHTRGRHKDALGHVSSAGRVLHEDDEEDDAPEEDDDDSAIDDRGCDDVDREREPEEWRIPSYGVDQTKGPEPHCQSEDRAFQRDVIEKIREERCVVFRSVWGGYRHKLMKPDHLAIAIQSAANLNN